MKKMIPPKTAGKHSPVPVNQEKPKTTSRVFKDLSAYVLQRARAQKELPPQAPKQSNIITLCDQAIETVKMMNQADARVKKTLLKLNELKLAILLAAGKR